MKLIFGTVPTYSKIFSYTIVRVVVQIGIEIYDATVDVKDTGWRGLFY